MLESTREKRDMKITITKEDAEKYRQTATKMIADGSETSDTHDGFVCVLDGSSAYKDRASYAGRIFYSFDHEGVLFHLSLD